MSEIQFHDIKTLPKHVKIAIVISRFNNTLCQGLLRGAQEILENAGLGPKQVDTYWVPGALEIPVTVKKLCQKKKVHAVICLGCVIQGETAHFDYVCQGALQGIAQLAQEFTIPILNGIITAHTLEQAKDRSADPRVSKHGNIGAHAAQACVEMVHLFQHLDLE